PNLIGEVSDYVIDAQGKYVIPGIIDDQVHFREPGLTHKAEIYTEAKAAVSGGVTSFMEMPNTKPASLTRTLLEEKYQKASEASLANYSFYMGVSNDNAEEAVKVDPKQVCGLKVFMGSSTGNMLVDDEQTLNNVFSKSPILIATHCEDEGIIRENMKSYREKYGEEMPIRFHPKVRSVEACLKSSSLAVALAKKHKSRLHVLHITTEEELDLFTNLTPLEKKRITSEVCVHHLYFDAEQYDELGNQIKCNPAIKVSRHRDALWKALMDNRLDIIATDHAPHTWEEKNKNYWEAPSGLPLVQHSLYIMLEFYRQGKISLAKIIEKMCHAPAICFQLEKRGFIREGYWADLVLLDLGQEYQVTPKNILHKCAWSPFLNHKFPGLVTHTFVSGHLAYHKGNFDESKMGMRLAFDR
ncbi:MAG: dihydroorotase, partial [Bacteroidota bacterium]